MVRLVAIRAMQRLRLRAAAGLTAGSMAMMGTAKRARRKEAATMVAVLQAMTMALQP